MSAVPTLRMKSYIQPFERELAVRELRSLTGDTATPLDLAKGLWRAPRKNATEASERLAYWETLDEAYTDQVRREATSIVARNGVGLGDIVALSREAIEGKIPRSRCLRYGPHGIHEYRGKFFPQLVKALINIAGVRNATVFDPMCGSGTTLVEAICSGNRAIGLDMNPLSVFISRAKCEALRVTSAEVVAGFELLRVGLRGSGKTSSGSKRDLGDQVYLERWFSKGVLAELDRITSLIDRVPHRSVANLFKVSLSNIVRRVSYQKEEDLRVRREDKKIDPVDVERLFLEEALRSAKAVTADIAHGVGRRVGRALVLDADARSFVGTGLIAEASVDLVITSPPYATALPYLDTDRLSLSCLGFLPRAEHRARDGEMIGNREITERTRRLQWQRYVEEGHRLPGEVRSLVEQIERENLRGVVGFRRRNLGALLAMYFFDMRSVLTEIQRALKPGGYAFLVVGNNRTRTPAGEIEIRTSELLLAVAQGLGFVDCQRVEMEMLYSRDIFRENRTPSEHILSMRRQ